MSHLPSIKSAKNLKNKTVLVRCDFDVPTKEIKKLRNKEIKVMDDSRLKACLPTINFLLQKQVKQIILIGHLGRPKGQVVSELSLEPVAKHLEKLLLKNVILRSRSEAKATKDPAENKLRIEFIKNIDGVPRRPVFSGLTRNDIPLAMLENLRFNPAEEKNDKTFAKQLSSMADIYVNEAFAVSHRSAASIDTIKKYLPSFAGLNLEREINNLSYVLEKPAHPFVAIIGGAKIETKLPVINQFLKTADCVLVGGAVANDFLLAQGAEVGESLVDKDYIFQARDILNLKIKNQKSKLQFKIKNYNLFKNYKIKNLKILIPIDWKEKNNKILDIGPKTIKNYCAIIKSAKTIVWNGPLGFFEDKKFAKGTNEIARAILNSNAKAVIGGGETGESIKSKVKSQKSKQNKNIFVSTGGGAMLEFLGGKKLPGLKK